MSLGKPALIQDAPPDVTSFGLRNISQIFNALVFQYISLHTTTINPFLVQKNAMNKTICDTLFKVNPGRAIVLSFPGSLAYYTNDLILLV